MTPCIADTINPSARPPPPQVFNRICYDQGSRRVDWDRPYITQVARFDPSKGIPDVLLVYQKLYHKYIEAFLPAAAAAATEVRLARLSSSQSSCFLLLHMAGIPNQTLKNGNRLTRTAATAAAGTRAGGSAWTRSCSSRRASPSLSSAGTARWTTPMAPGCVWG